MEDVLLIGAGGHAKSIIDSILSNGEFKIFGIIDKKEMVGDKVNGINIVGADEELSYFYDKGIKKAFVCIGNNKVRKKLINKLEKIGFELISIIDRTAIIAKNTTILDGCFIGKGAIINSNSVIKKGPIINTGAIIEHDCIIGEYVHVAPGTTLCGGVEIGNETFIGANSVVIQYKKIGSDVLIGAGSVVTKDINNKTICYGNPCRKVEK